MKKIISFLIVFLSAVYCFAKGLVIESKIDSLWIQLEGIQASQKIEISSQHYKEMDPIVGVLYKGQTQQANILLTDIHKKTNGTHHDFSNGVEVVYDLYTEPCYESHCFTSKKLKTIHVKITDLYINGKSVIAPSNTCFQEPTVVPPTSDEKESKWKIKWDAGVEKVKKFFKKHF